MLAVDVVPRRFLQPLVDVRVARDAIDVDRLHGAATDQAERRVAGGGDEVVSALGHQRDHLVGGAGGLDVDLAGRVLLERRHPIVILVGLAALDVSGPGDDVDLALERLGGWSGRCGGRFLRGFGLLLAGGDRECDDDRQQQALIRRREPG